MTMMNLFQSNRFQSMVAAVRQALPPIPCFLTQVMTKLPDAPSALLRRRTRTSMSSMIAHTNSTNDACGYFHHRIYSHTATLAPPTFTAPPPRQAHVQKQLSEMLAHEVGCPTCKKQARRVCCKLAHTSIRGPPPQWRVAVWLCGCVSLAIASPSAPSPAA